MVRTVLSMGLLVFSLWGFADDESTSKGGTVVLEVDGVKFTTADLEKKGSATLFQARTNLYDAERKAADDLVNDYLLEREAKKENVSVDELVKRHTSEKVNKPIPEDALLTGPLEPPA